MYIYLSNQYFFSDHYFLLLLIQYQLRQARMDALSEENYNTVLAYMEQTNQQDFQRAAEVLKLHGFDLQRAIALGIFAQQAPELHEQLQQQVLAQRYGELLRNKEQRSNNVFTLLYYGVKYFLITVFKGIASIMLPSSLFARIMYPKFYGLYFRQLHLPIQKSSLKDLLLSTRHYERKSVIVAVSPNEVDPNLTNLLNRVEISESIAILFKFVGYTLGDENLKLLGEVENRSQLIVCRMNILEEVVVINRFFVDNFDQITPEKLRQSYALGVQQMKNDKKVFRLYRRYRNALKGRLFLVESSEDEEPDYAEQEKVSHEIAAQNEVYEALEKEKDKEEQKMIREQERMQQENQLRKIRKLSIPEEPKEGKFVRINFRCPNGATLARNFPPQEKVDLIYNWVDVNEDIQFQDQSRKFELMYSYPLKPLAEFKEKLIGEIFEDSQEKIVIREL